MSDANLLRIVIAIVGVVLLAAMYYFGTRHKPKQGERVVRRGAPAVNSSERVEPTMGGKVDLSEGLDPETHAELKRLEREIRGEHDEPTDSEIDALTEDDIEDTATSEPAAPRRAPPPNIGNRADDKIERIVSVFVCARPGETIGGAELVVAAEKAGLRFGAMSIFHRLVDGRTDVPPIFSVANMIKPGDFDLSRVAELRTPGVTFFLTLPGPVSALDAWDTMYPAAQRLAELLDAQVLDENKNAIGRQTIQHIRDDLRAWDRKQEKNTIRRSW